MLTSVQPKIVDESEQSGRLSHDAQSQDTYLPLQTAPESNEIKDARAYPVTAIYDSIIPAIYSNMSLLKEYASHGFLGARSVVERANIYFEKHTTLRTFAYSAGILSIVPLTIFSTCFLISLAISTVTAIFGVILIQSVVFFVGISVLVPVEIAVVFVAGGAAIASKAIGFAIDNHISSRQGEYSVKQVAQ